ncbi:YfjI family protein [Pseudomonas aeruginosa]|uniref:YfjI family protein n=1 Tax=Pseudomonas aeruginosa TaxID=287 RepID=UPI0009A42F67|nr:YfjI family protein [Pseudomonas aeruginosa]MBX6190268.1 DUF3987 domain-containing protein [Pseudomonas aeruginosa]MBX6716942.1 DUF3987 domain-containing protein [Pseudomonas aeruginosa]MBX6872421.1 DUF3987 domain-containing protein [Pseudomonas aeruginosa]QKL13003.1 DUF3987 domain-containing protein [Pseudomonas aeruginosa]QQV96179.1 DUF3987 domain-containing protein [Pseudomonas aeruginosa]
MTLEDPISPSIKALSEFPTLKEFILEVVETTQAPIELVLASALTTISMLCQPLIDVKRPGEMTGPVSLLTIIIANSGERKTTVEKIFLSHIREYIKNSMQNHKRELLTWELKHEAWSTRKRRIIQEMSSNPTDSSEYFKLENELLMHQSSKPERPRAFNPIYEDTTTAALLQGMQFDTPWASLISSEGISILKGAFNDYGKINSLWSGSDIEVARTTSESCSLHDARLTVGIMIQHQILLDYLESKGDRARSVGLLSRALVFHPISTQGTRFITDKKIHTEIMEKYKIRVNSLLKSTMERLHDVAIPKKIIELSSVAAAHWISTFNRIESELKNGGEYERSKDHASKLSENIARVAALLHYFERGDGTISLEEIKSAEIIVLECSKTFKNEFEFMPKIINDAEILYNWIQLKGYRTPFLSWIEKNTILQRGPTRLRSASKLNQVLDCLAAMGKIRINSKYRPVRIELTPPPG